MYGFNYHDHYDLHEDAVCVESHSRNLNSTIRDTIVSLASVIGTVALASGIAVIL